jgi:hypothetical protein
MERLRVSENRRFLVTASGTPFFWLGDTAWELFHRGTLEDAELYLETRRQQQFNVIQAVVLAEFDGLRMPNMYGHCPLLEDDPTKPNEAYFQHVDAVIHLAAAKGLYIGLLPTWGDKVNKLWGIGPVIFDTHTARQYGEFIGRRYRDAPNIIWIMGGDREEITDGVDYAPVWRAMAAGIQTGVGGHTLMTYHPRGGRGSSQTFHQDAWLDCNMWQSGHMHPDIPNWELITQDYERMPIKPVLDGEPNYEDHPINPFTRQWLPEYGYFRDDDVRKQAYRAVFAGACGHTYGHHSVWQMFTPERTPINYPDRPWQDAITRPGANQMRHLHALIESRPFLNRIPDQTLIVSDVGEAGQHIRATRSEDGSYALVYIPNAGREVTISTYTLTGTTFRAWWYDPRNGTAHMIAELSRPQDNCLILTTPTSAEDWVLVIDDAAHNFLAPGDKP